MEAGRFWKKRTSLSWEIIPHWLPAILQVSGLPLQTGQNLRLQHCCLFQIFLWRWHSKQRPIRELDNSSCKERLSLCMDSLGRALSAHPDVFIPSSAEGTCLLLLEIYSLNSGEGNNSDYIFNCFMDHTADYDVFSKSQLIFIFNQLLRKIFHKASLHTTNFILDLQSYHTSLCLLC